MFGGIGIAWLAGLIMFSVSALLAMADISWRFIRFKDLNPRDGWPWLFRLMTYVGMGVGVVLYVGDWFLIRWLEK